MRPSVEVSHQLVDHGGGGKLVARLGIARDVRQVKTLSRTDESLEKQVFVALAWADVARLAVCKRQVKRVRPINGRKLSLPQTAKKNHTKRQRPHLQEWRDDDSVGQVMTPSSGQPIEGFAQALIRDPVTNLAAADIEARNCLDLLKALRQCPLFRVGVGSKVGVYHASKESGPLSHGQSGRTRKPRISHQRSHEHE